MSLEAAPATLSNATFLGNTAAKLWGGGLATSHAVGLQATVVAGCTFALNTAARSGGAIYADEAPLDLRAGTVVRNNSVVWGGGGGVWVSSTTLAMDGVKVLVSTVIMQALVWLGGAYYSYHGPCIARAHRHAHKKMRKPTRPPPSPTPRHAHSPTHPLTHTFVTSGQRCVVRRRRELRPVRRHGGSVNSDQ